MVSLEFGKQDLGLLEAGKCQQCKLTHWGLPCVRYTIYTIHSYIHISFYCIKHTQSMLMLMVISDLPVCSDSIYIVEKVNERTKGVLGGCFCYCSYFVELSCECFLIYDDPQILVTLVTGSLQPLHGSTLEECGEQDQCPGSVSCAQYTVHS